MVRVTPAGSSTNAAAQPRGELGDAAERVGVGECALELGIDDRVGVARLVATGVADRLLAFGVGPAGAVGDQLAVVADEQVADELPQRVELAVAGVHQPGADVVAEPEIAAGRLGVSGPSVRPALLVLCRRVAELVVVDAGAGEVRLLARRCRLDFAELLVYEVEHEGGVDDPDPGGEVASALVDECVSTVAGAVAYIGGDVELECPALGAGGERVELGVEPLELTAQDGGELAMAVGGEVGAGVLDLLCGVEHRAVVDSHGVRVLVFDDGAMDERAEVPQRLVVQVAGRDPLGDRLGELGGDLMHVGELVCHRDRDLLAGGPVGDAGTDPVREASAVGGGCARVSARCRGRCRPRRSGRRRAGRHGLASSLRTAAAGLRA